MNRDIEFRGMHSNKWLYGYLVKSVDDNKYYITVSTDQFYQVKKETIGQYTGLKDKNGKKIFEGDIVKYRSAGYGVDKKGKIIYKTKKYVIDYDIKMLMFYLKAKNGKDDEIFDITDKKEWIEVIGNIYENKELLED